MENAFDTIFSTMPVELRDSLNKHYHKIKLNFVRKNYEPSELNGGKFCEIVYRILEWHTSGGSFTDLGIPIPNLGQNLRQFENKTAFNDSIRMHIPRVLNAVYDIRNKRGVAHHAAEIDPNHMDASFVVASTDWVMAELVRIFHNVSITEAQSIVESLINKQIPVIWQLGDHKRVLSPPNQKFVTKDKILILLYSTYPEPIPVSNLLTWTEYDTKNKARFRNSLLKDLHAQELLHFDSKLDMVYLSPVGLKWVEDQIQLEF